MSTKRQPLEARLQDPAAAEALVGLAFDFAVGQPVGRYVDPAKLHEHVAAALTGAGTERVLREHLRPALDREHARAKARGDRVADWLTAEAQAELRSLVSRPVRLKRSFLEGLVKQPAVQGMLRSVVQETLDRFLQTLKPGGSGGGMLGALGRGAVGMAGAFLGNLGSQLEQQLQRAAQSFVASSMNLILERFVAILSAPETAAQMGRMNLVGYEEVMKLPTHVVLGQVFHAPVDDLLEVVPGLLAHNLARPEIRQGLLEELEAALTVEAEKPVRALLDEGGLTASVRAEVLRVVTPLVVEFAATPELKGWLAAAPG